MKFHNNMIILATMMAMTVINIDAFTSSLGATRTQRIQSSSTRPAAIIPPRSITATTSRITQLHLFPVMESSTIVTSLAEGFVEGLGSLALLGSVGIGVAFSNVIDPDWTYEYKVGNDGHYVGGGSLSSSSSSSTAAASVDLALLGESPKSIQEKMEEEKEIAVVASSTISATNAVITGLEESSKIEVAASPPPPVAVVAATVESVKAPSKEILQSTEVAKAKVQKVGVQEVKERMSSKSTAMTLPPPPTPPSSSLAVETLEKSSSSSTQIAEIRETKSGKRALAKGISLIFAAGVVAVVRNVVKAYLGRGIL